MYPIPAAACGPGRVQVLEGSLRDMTGRRVAVAEWGFRDALALALALAGGRLSVVTCEGFEVGIAVRGLFFGPGWPGAARVGLRPRMGGR